MIAALPTNPAERAAIGIQLRDALYSVYGKEAVNAAAEKVLPKFAEWPDEYRNRETGKVYKPHSDAEQAALTDVYHRYLGILGGEGAGKSVLGIRRDLERLKTGNSGILVSPDLPHFKRSLWPEFRRWCPWDQVHPKHQYMGALTWQPYAPFILTFQNSATLYCGGMDDPGSWEGPNIHFAHFDEARRKKTAAALKVLDGRVRIPGLAGEPPQIWLTTTPRKHWLFTFFSGLLVQCKDCNLEQRIEIQSGEPEVCKQCGSANLKVTDELEAFKRDSLVIRLYTKDNEINLEKDFARKRAQTLTEAEARVLLDAAWEDIEEGQLFLPSILWWDECKRELPELDKREPLILAVDAATGRQSGESDCFAIVALSRHPDRRKDAVAVRYVRVWQAKSGHKLDFVGTKQNPGPEREMLRLCGWDIDEDGRYVKIGDGYNVKCITCDPTDLNDLIARFRRRRVVYMKEFGQVKDRIKSDTDLLRLIQEKRVVHDGNATLRRHIANADRKLDEGGHRLRIVKREDSLKIDAAVALSMGAFTCLRLNLG